MYVREKPIRNEFRPLLSIYHFEGRSYQYVLIPVLSILCLPDYVDYTITEVLLSDQLLFFLNHQSQSGMSRLYK